METKHIFKNFGRKKIQIKRFYKKLNEISNNNPPKVIFRLVDLIDSYQIIEISFSEKVKDEILNLGIEYEDKINRACPNCGKIENYDSLCNKCYNKWERKTTIKQNKVSKNGFQIYKDISTKRFDSQYRYNYIKWSDLESVDIDEINNLVLIFVLNKKDFQGNIITFSYFSFQENFFYLLKNIPENLFSIKSLKFRNEILSLTCCGVCGFVSKSNNFQCFVCNTSGLWKSENLNDRQIKQNETALTINSKLQKSYYDSLKNEYRYPKLEKEFEKCKKYEILI